MSNSNSTNNNLPKGAVVKSGRRFHWSPVSVASFIVFALYGFTLIGSLAWAFLNALKTRFEYMESVVALPKSWLFSNFGKAFEVLQANDKSAVVMLINSLWLSVFPPTISVITSAMASYVMAKYKFPGRSLIWSIMITIMVIPIYGSTASTFKMYKFLHFYDSPLILITSITGIGGNMMMIAAFEGVSKTYSEAAFIEGAGHFRIFWQIMLPQVAGLMSALWIMGFIGAWNNYMLAITYMPSFTTLSTGLYLYQKENERTLDIPLLFAGALMCLLPVLALFIAFQDKFINLSFGSGVKG